MRPFSAPSEHAVLSLNSTRPSNRRRRRPRFELQLERLEDRQLLSGSTSSSPVLFHDTFSSNAPSSAWSFVGGTWKINHGVLRQTGTAAADPKKAMITNQTYPSNLIVTSEVRVNSWKAGDSARAGIGLYTNTSNGDGYNLVFHGTKQVQFLNDKVTWGNAYTFNWKVGTWYWFQLEENNGTLEGKVWAAGTAEPQNWMFQQTGWADLKGGAPALNGGSGGSTDSFASVSVTTTAVQPDTANAGSAFAATTGSAVTFSQATATGTGPLTYAWNFGDGGTATALNPTHTYQSAGTFTAQLTVTDALGIPATSTLTATVNPTTPTNPTGTYSANGTVGIVDTNYPIPAGAYFVATTGSDSNSGSQTSPWKTIGHAVAASSSGSTIVIYGGTYREGAISISGKKLTLQPYPNEQVWLNGSLVVSNWVASGSVWASSGWNYQFAVDTPSQAIDPNYPLAGHRDMVFIDGMPLTLVGSLSQVGPGEFYVNYSNDTLYIGSNPNGQTVEAASQAVGLYVNYGADGTIVRGLGFEHYATSYGPTQAGALRVNCNSVTVEDNTFAYNAICRHGRG